MGRGMGSGRGLDCDGEGVGMFKNGGFNYIIHWGCDVMGRDGIRGEATL